MPGRIWFRDSAFYSSLRNTCAPQKLDAQVSVSQQARRVCAERGVRPSPAANLVVATRRGRPADILPDEPAVNNPCSGRSVRNLAQNDYFATTGAHEDFAVVSYCHQGVANALTTHRVRRRVSTGSLVASVPGA